MAPITFAVRQGVLACQDVVEGRAFDYEEEEQVLATRRRERADAYAALRQEARLAAATAEEERLAALGHSYNSVNKARTAVAPRIDEARARQGRTLRDAEDADDRWEREHGARISVLSGERNGTRVYDRLARQHVTLAREPAVDDPRPPWSVRPAALATSSSFTSLGMLSPKESSPPLHPLLADPWPTRAPTSDGQRSRAFVYAEQRQDDAIIGIRHETRQASTAVSSLAERSHLHPSPSRSPDSSP